MTELSIVPDPQPLPTPAPAGEYPLSTLCLKVRVGEVEMSWTLRGDDSDVARRLPRALATIKKLQEDGKLPAARPQPAPQPPPGRGQGQALEAREDWCSIHQCAMVRQENERGAWFSHRLPEGGYCKGKRQRAGERA